MRTKLFFGVVLCLLFSSCIKDYLGHGDDENDNGFLTETNYLYADDLKVAFLEDNLELLIEEQKFLDDVLAAGQATDEQKERSKEVNNEIEDTNTSIGILQDYRAQVFAIVGPRPPCPKPRLCDFWLDMIYVTPAPDFITYQLTVYDANQNIIGQSEGDPKGLIGVNGLINYVDFIWSNKDYKGEILLKAVGTTDKGIEDVSFITSNIN